MDAAFFFAFDSVCRVRELHNNCFGPSQSSSSICCCCCPRRRRCIVAKMSINPIVVLLLRYIIREEKNKRFKTIYKDKYENGFEFYDKF